MASELQTQDREIDRNPTEASVSSTLTKELEKDVNNGYAFRFKLPSDGLSLRSVAIVDGAPELRFAASPKVPTISEEDMAVAIRLAAEGKRPEFFYIGIPFGPFSGRRYKRYIPQWLRGTSFGESLADADWNMKCLGLGARAKDHESPFSAWQETSNLDNLATHLDFPEEKQVVHQLSCPANMPQWKKQKMNWFSQRTLLCKLSMKQVLRTPST